MIDLVPLPGLTITGTRLPFLVATMYSSASGSADPPRRRRDSEAATSRLKEWDFCPAGRKGIPEGEEKGRCFWWMCEDGDDSSNCGVGDPGDTFEVAEPACPLEEPLT